MIISHKHGFVTASIPRSDLQDTQNHAVSIGNPDINSNNRSSLETVTGEFILTYLKLVGKHSEMVVPHAVGATEVRDAKRCSRVTNRLS